MTSIKAKFRLSPIEDGSGTVYYQIIHERRVCNVSTGMRLTREAWDENTSNVVARVEFRTHRNQIRHDIERLARIVRRFEEERMTFTAHEIGQEYKAFMRDYSLFSFMESVIKGLKQMGRQRTSETYRAALNSFSKFRSGCNVMLDCLTPEIVEEYEAWLLARGNVPNTVSFYMRILRALYNRAVDRGVIENHNPFRHVYTGVDKTVKRAITVSTIRRIMSLDLSAQHSLDFARDMFLMSFYLRGMSFVDMAFLRKSDLKRGSVTYRRRKTGQRLTIGWTPEMQAVMDKYPPNSSEYLLPIIRRTGLNERRVYLNMGYSINYNLKKVGDMAGLTMPLTLYVARHSWASAAKASGIPVSVISEGMGHDSETTTQIYLASLDTTVVDRANSIILSKLR